MPWNPKISVGLVRCGRCGKRYSNPLTHTCVVRMDRKTKPKRSLKPKASVALVTCGTCGKPYANPLTHVCQVRTDFKRRLAAGDKRRDAEAKRQAAAPKKRPKPPARPAHNYRACRDPECGRQACQAWREGYADGYQDGLRDGRDQSAGE